MTEHDFDRFSAVMFGVAENYGQSLSSQGVMLRFKTLAGYGIDEIERAACTLIMCRKYTTMPTVAATHPQRLHHLLVLRRVLRAECATERSHPHQATSTVRRPCCRAHSA